MRLVGLRLWFLGFGFAAIGLVVCVYLWWLYSFCLVCLVLHGLVRFLFVLRTGSFGFRFNGCSGF